MRACGARGGEGRRTALLACMLRRIVPRHMQALCNCKRRPEAQAAVCAYELSLTGLRPAGEEGGLDACQGKQDYSKHAPC